MTQVFPELRSSIGYLKAQEDYTKQAKLARNSGQIDRGALLGNIVAPLNRQANLLFNIAAGKIKLQQKLLQDRPDDEVEFFRATIAALENWVTRTAPLIERQKLFLERAEEFSPAQQSEMEISFQASHKSLQDL